MNRGVLGSLDGSTFRISFALNGQELGSWGQFNMTGVGGDELGFQGFEFTWNPEDGDLVLVLALAPNADGGGGGLATLGAEEEEEEVPSEMPGEDPPPPPPPEEEEEGECCGSGEEQPPGPPVTAVPEPSTWALLIGGFGLAGASLRRRRAALRI